TEEPQQVAGHQVGDLRVAVEDLADQVLAQGAIFRHVGQGFQQLVEALEEQCVAVVGNLLGLAEGDQNAAQLGEQGQVVFEIGSGHGNPVSVGAREYTSGAPSAEKRPS